MSAAVVELHVGARVWFEGGMYLVRELDPQRTMLASDGNLRSVATADLVRHATLVSDDTGDQATHGEPVNVVLSGLTKNQRATLEQRAALVRGVLHADPADTRSLKQRCADAAAEHGVSTRTVLRWISGYRQAGLAGLADSRMLNRYAPSVDPRWDAACLAVLREHVSSSTPTMNVVIDRVRRQVEEEHGPGVVVCPPRTTAYRRLGELSKGRHAFGSGKTRRSVANRPGGPYGRLRATRPGEYVVLDTTPLDVFAMEPVTLRWVPVELTIAQDLFTRCVLGLRLSPVSTKSADVANVLYQCVTPQRSGADDGWWPFHGVPANLLVGTEDPDGLSQERVAGLPACLPEAIVVDHGKTYLSEHVIAACARLGITVQPAIPYKPTDKPTIERFFRTLNQGLLQHLPAYKGPDVFHRGADVEDQAFLYVAELEQIIREWIGTVYHHTKHDGLCVPEVPGMALAPAEMFAIGLTKTGGLTVPAHPDLPFLFLDVAWRTVQHYGVEVHGRRYDGPTLNTHRNRKSPYGGVHAGKWPIFLDAHDVRRVWFQDPDTKTFSPLEWEHAPGLDQPFSRDAAEYTKKLALRENRHVDPLTAVQDLLGAWSKQEVTTRRDKAMALKLASTRSHDVGGLPGGSEAATTGEDGQRTSAAEQVASLPGVVDLLAERTKRQPLQVVDDVDDVFARYYEEHPDADGLEVFDE
ncbi:MAG: helix-turn-helix domain-containing protein [Ornithinimicrobium sp.]|uniref:helix-turn-helix domain-containing protein n=1 Tax=Ornithinimicrobium sp. TaxID=1977084 RepID=UPI0026E00C80|nr:helix-turn-helix domain-containing protein [Ornithinimicrobium sp.]MDO5740615.1 helix-turn-helix domain-containing protein [Ornithinimicrobium sp.]